jgi:hypothetical protein
MLKEQSRAKRTFTGKLISSGLSVRKVPERVTFCLACMRSSGVESLHPKKNRTQAKSSSQLNRWMLPIADVSPAVVVRIRLVRICIAGAIVAGIADAIAVFIVVFIGFAPFAEVLCLIVIPVIVIILIALISSHIACQIIVAVFLIGIYIEGAVVYTVRNAVVIVVGIAGITDAIAIGIGLEAVEDHRTIVRGIVEHAIAIHVVITWIADAVPVDIISVVAGNLRTKITGIAEVISILVLTLIVGHTQAGVAGIDRTVNVQVLIQ